MSLPLVLAGEPAVFARGQFDHQTRGLQNVYFIKFYWCFFRGRQTTPTWLIKLPNRVGTAELQADADVFGVSFWDLIDKKGRYAKKGLNNSLKLKFVDLFYGRYDSR